MALHRILVVDDSPAIRETIGILLGGEYDVRASKLDDYLVAGIPEREPPQLIIAADCEALQRAPTHPFPTGVPVLWLVDEAALAVQAGNEWDRLRLLPRHFSPRELRRQVHAILCAPAARPAAESGDWRLQRPYLPAEAVGVVAEAVASQLPLHLQGEQGVGRRSVARAVHVARGAGPFLAACGNGFDIAALAGEGLRHATLYVDAVDRLTPAAQQRLLACLEPSGILRLPCGTGVRLMTSTTADLAALAEGSAFSRDLFYRLTVLTACLPPLRERAADIPGIVERLAAELASWLGRPAAVFTERALVRLSNYLWYGNLAELETVLVRTLAIRAERTIDADDLLFDGARMPARRGSNPAAARHQATPALLGHRSLDLIINELAHEFKNPLVTIKTFAHHLRRLMRDGADEAQAARLTGEAVAQMDQTLENLLEFTRLDTPALQSVPFAAVVGPVLDEYAEALARRGVDLQHSTPPAATIRGDPEQLAYALGNLVRALARDLVPHASLVVEFGEPASMTIQLPAGAAPLGSQLATLLDASPNGHAVLPLGVAIAKAVLERNGAQVAVAVTERQTVTVRFALADTEQDVVVGNGTSPRIGR